MFGKIFKRKKQKKEEPEKLARGIRHRTQQVFDLISEGLNRAKEELAIIKTKCENLLQTNYELGMKHLDNGNINEATFRFKFIKKFWPDHLESYYQLAYCLILKNKLHDAQQVLEELVAKDESYRDDAAALLDIIQTAKNKGND